MDVLLVEDDYLVRELICDDLAESGLSFVAVASAEDGLRAVNDNEPPPAVLVTDVNLGPGMDGIALAAEGRRRWPGVAVVVMTGNAGNLVQMPVDLRNECFLKPFNPLKLVAAVTSLMRRSQKEA
jgi:DNA-binding response OmpR family regulator